MLISDVLHAKGQHEVLRIRTIDRVTDAVGRLWKHSIGALWSRIAG